MSTYLVTGAAGFIGSAITTALVTRGDTVRGLDNLTTGCVQNIALVRDRIEFTVGDMRDRALLALLCKGVDVIFHQAAIVSVQQSIDDPLGTWDVNVEGTRALIEEATKAGVRRIVFASSSAVYGEPVRLPADENSPFRPLSPYANQKLACEMLLQNAEAESALETVCLRCFNVFGPRQSANSPYAGVIARFLHGSQSGASEQITVFGDGTSTRDFVFIDDVVAANLSAADASPAGVSGRAFNIGTGQSRTIQQVATCIRQLSGSSESVAHGPARPGDILHSVADIRLAQQLLGYVPLTPFEEGLRTTREWFRSLTPVPAGKKPSSPRIVAGLQRRGIPRSTVSHCIANNEFSLAFQPIVRLPSGKPFGVEALLRHKFEDRNRAPLRIIREAEATGTDIELGAWTLAASCQAAKRLQQSFGPDFRMSVNVSMNQLESPGFLELVQDTLAASQVAPATLEIEITERILLSQAKMARHNLRGLQESGISVALDDFGSGQANLQHLCKLKVNRLKTDRSMLLGSSRRWPIFDGLVAFARQLHIPLVAEGIETRAQLEKVLRIGCKEAQGYLFGRPATLETLLQSANVNSEVA